MAFTTDQVLAIRMFLIEEHIQEKLICTCTRRNCANS